MRGGRMRFDARHGEKGTRRRGEVRGRPLPLFPGFLVGLSLAFLPGCAASHTAQPLAPELARNDADTQVEFWHALPDRKAVSNDEAFHAVLLFVDGGDPTADYD